MDILSELLRPGPPRLDHQLSIMMTSELRDLIKELAVRASLSQAEVARRLLQDAAERLMATNP
jgi:hypothetical protein